MSETIEESKDISLAGFDDDLGDLKIPGFDDDAVEATADEEAGIDQSLPNKPQAKTEEEQIDEEAEKVVSGLRDEKPKPAQAKPKAAEGAAPAAKKLTFKSGESALELDEDSVIEWKVDGKLVPIKARELLDNYAGKTAWDRKFQETANEKKALQQRNQEFETRQNRQKGLVVDMYEKVKGGKLFEATADLIELTGMKVDPREYIKQLRSAFMEQAEQMRNFTPEQREVYELKEEREYLAAKYAKLNQHREQEEAQRASQVHMTTVAEKAGVEYDTLAQTMEFMKEHARKSGGDPGTVTPEAAVAHLETVKSFEVARDAIAAVEPDLIKDNMVTDEARWEKLAKLYSAHKDLTKEEFIELYQESRKKNDAARVAQKLKDAPTSTPAKGATKKRKDPEADAFDFTKISAEDSRW